MPLVTLNSLDPKPKITLGELYDRIHTEILTANSTEPVKLRISTQLNYILQSSPLYSTHEGGGSRFLVPLEVVFGSHEDFLEVAEDDDNY